MFFRKLCRNTIVPAKTPTQNQDRNVLKSRSCGNLAEAPRREHSEAYNQYHNANQLNQNIPASPPPSYSPRSRNPHQQQQYPHNHDISDSDESGISEGQPDSNLRGVYCPDLLHACSLILPSQQYEDHLQRNSLGRSLSLSSVEYAEIDEISNTFAEIRTNAETSPASNNSVQSTTNRPDEGRCLASGTSDQAMGQSLSLRRPRISLTWVLREQQPQQQQPTNSNTQSETKPNVDKKKLKNKGKDENLFTEKYVGNHNLQEYQEKREPSKELLFVCTPQKQTQTVFATEDRKLSKFKYATAQLKTDEQAVEVKSLKGTYSEPSLIAASEGNQRRHRHRKRRDRNRLQKFGYEIRNVDEFLSKCSLSSPGNIPVVLSSSSILYQTRPGGYQIEIPLPLGMVVNAVFKNQNWLYVQTPHAEEGYVGYACCLPLGILPPAIRTTPTSRPTPCWENTGDVFPRPCGNMTDSEKEIRLRGGTRSEGARTPRSRKVPLKACGEHHVDKLYLRAASQPRLTEKSFAQLKPTNAYASTKCINDEYVVLQHRARIAQKQSENGNSKCKSLRQTLVAITNDYRNGNIFVQKDEIVTLLECRDAKDGTPWFYVKKSEGQRGFIPAEVAGHGFL